MEVGQACETNTAQPIGVSIVVSVARSVQAPSRWLSRHLPKPIRWLAGFAWFGVFTFGLGMIRLDEYFVADICWVVSFLIFTANVILCRRHYVIKVFLVVAAVISLVGLFIWTDIKKADKAWSILTEQRVQYRLSIRPTHMLVPPPPSGKGVRHLTEDGLMLVEMWLFNDSVPQTEIQNVQGRMWVVQSGKVIRSNRPPDQIFTGGGIESRFWYFDVRVLHKSTGGMLVRWEIVPPRPGESVHIGADTISSKTDRQMSDWDIVPGQDGVPRIVATPSTPASGTEAIPKK